LTRYDEILYSMTSELALHRVEIERNETDPDINLSWLELRIYLDHSNQRPVKVAFKAESIRNLTKR